MHGGYISLIILHHCWDGNSVHQLLENKDAKRVIDAIRDIRFVGGCVRDAILGREIHDIDFATTKTPHQIISLLESHNIKAIPTGLKHGTITAVINKQGFEITTLRQDMKCDGRHAEIKFTNQWYEDATRRDFTFNALYLDQYGEIYDYFDGINDLQNQYLRFIGDADTRIREDYLRILRAFRFQVKICKGKIPKKIIDTCRRNTQGIDQLSGERIQSEMMQLLSLENSVDAISIMYENSILEHIIPGEININDIIHDIPNFPIEKLAVLISNYQFNHVKSRWKISNHTAKTLTFLLKNTIPALSSICIDDIPKHISRIGRHHLTALVMAQRILGKCDNYHEILIEIDTCKIPDFPISGRDLIRIGMKPGPDMGTMLVKLREKWINNDFSLNKDQLLDDLYLY